MREILFRGKRIDNGKWVEGFLSFHYVDGRNKDGFVNIGMSRIYDQNEAMSCDVLTDTVGQYTGLCDKNGKKIFEGDILGCGDRIVYVKWHEQCGIWDSHFVKYTNNTLCSNGVTAVEWKFRAAVIGNIHDNPELLEATP